MFRDLPLLANAGIFAAAAAVVWFAGTRLAVLVDGISQKTGIGSAMLGMALLGGITSMPEIAIALTASLQGTPVLSINDVLGSAAANLVILAVADAVIGKDALTSIQESPEVLLLGVLGMALLAITIGAVVTGDVPFLGMGAWTWVLLVGFIVSLRVVATSRAGAAWKVAKSRAADGEDEKRMQGRSLGSLITWTVVTAAAILAAGFVLTKTGDALAHQSGLGASFFAVVFLAIATSLPEISTVLSAIRLRRYDLAISDVLGTNLFNVTIIVLVDFLSPGAPVLTQVGRTASVGALLALVLTAIFLVGVLERRDRTVLRMGYDSAAVLAAYVAGLFLLYQVR